MDRGRAVTAHRERARRWRQAVAIVAALIGLTVVASQASAVGALAARAEPTKIDGAADFRTAPRLTDGDYVDSVVAGDAVWYSLLYTNNVPYEFTAALTDEAPEGTAFTIEFVSPSLEPIGEPDPAKVSGTAYYGSGDETYTWYIKVSLASTGEVGTAYGMTLSIQGATGGRTTSCDDLADCTADDDAREAEASLDTANAELADTKANGGEEAVRQQIDDGRDQIAQLDADLEPEPTTPIGVVVLLMLIGVVAALTGFVWSRRRSGSSAPGDPPTSDNVTPLADDPKEADVSLANHRSTEIDPRPGEDPHDW